MGVIGVATRRLDGGIFIVTGMKCLPVVTGSIGAIVLRPKTQPDIKRNQWICAEFMLKENTPGKPDGEQAFWIDGELRGHWKGVNWRKSKTLHANALTLEAYVTDRWTKNPVNAVYFDNVVIASEYIGASGAAFIGLIRRIRRILSD